MPSTIDVQINFEGRSPIVLGDKRLTLINLSRLLRGLDAGVQYKSGNSFVQVQTGVVAASATATCASVQNGDTVTIAGQALTAAQKRATGTVTFASATAGDTITVNGVVFTAVNGAVTPGQATFDVSGTDTQDAASFVTQLAAYSDYRLNNIVSSRSAAAVVTLFAVNEGTSGNAITLASSNGTRLAVSGATLANGAAPSNNTFDWVGTNNTTAASLAACITNSTTAAIKQVTASANSAVVTVTSKVGGLAGNTITFVSSNGTRLAVTGSGFLAGGTASAVTRWSF